MFPSVALSLSLSDSASLGKSRPFSDTPLVLSHTHPLSIPFSVSLFSFQPSIQLCAFLSFISGVFEARENAVASGVVQSDRMMSLKEAEAHWTDIQTTSVNIRIENLNRNGEETHFEYAFPNLSPNSSQSLFYSSVNMFLLNVKYSSFPVLLPKEFTTEAVF